MVKKSTPAELAAQIVEKYQDIICTYLPGSYVDDKYNIKDFSGAKSEVAGWLVEIDDSVIENSTLEELALRVADLMLENYHTPRSSLAFEDLAVMFGYYE